MDYTDITFELFNYCNGSCTGCALSSKERKVFELFSSLDDIFKALKKIKDYSNETQLNHRVIFSFGDVPKLDWEIQHSIYNKCLELDLAFGLTLTLVDETFDYISVLHNIYSLFSQSQYRNNKNNQESVILDLTIDPVRIKNLLFTKNYCNNIKSAIKINPGIHLQVLLSSYVMSHFTPEKLYQTLCLAIEDKPILLGFSPTLENLEEKQRYHYQIENAFDYAKVFYHVNNIQKEFLKEELKRFKTNDLENINQTYTNNHNYFEFAKQTYHINHRLELFPVSYTIYGDIIRDERNNLKALGNILTKNISDILNEHALTKLNLKNMLAMENSSFGCEQCIYFDSCSFNGIGLVRNLYRHFEEKVGNCYGPINFST
jgi:hypothetical protein